MRDKIDINDWLNGVNTGLMMKGEDFKNATRIVMEIAELLNPFLDENCCIDRDTINELRERFEKEE